MKVQEFNIKSLEGYTGVKAHTIRMWEQRYGLLSPRRTDTNIRRYTDDDLRTLLNVSFLNQHGYRISEIAAMTEEERHRLVQEVSRQRVSEDVHQHSLKLAMLNYDERLFNSVVDLHIASNGLERTFHQLFVPILRQIGALWMSGDICPAQEHFISNLIRQKLISHIDKIGPDLARLDSPTIVLYLPESELHELSLLMLNFSLRSRGSRTVYLGQEVPLEDLYQLYERIGDATFVTILTSHIGERKVSSYLERVTASFSKTPCRFFFSIPGATEIEAGANIILSENPSLMMDLMIGEGLV
ncbi:MAG: MerR family transcriptional regulator [Flavobacteriales bacterium]|nr:MerR family transcriptional regulator [Flavobacteriales bacterium]